MATNSSPPACTGGVSRRGLLAGGAALAGAGLLGRGEAVAGAARSGPHRRRAAGSPRPPVPPPVVLEGGTLLDPLTGEVTEDAIVVLAKGKVLAAGPASRMAGARAHGPARRSSTWRGDGSCPGCSMPTPTRPPSRRPGARCRAAPRPSASRPRRSTRTSRSRRSPSGSRPRIPTVQPSGLFVRPLTGDQVLSDPGAGAAGARCRTVPDPGAAALPRAREPQPRRRPHQDLGDAAGGRVRAGSRRSRPTTSISSARSCRPARPRPVMCHSHGADGCHAAVEAGVTSLEHGTFVSDETLRLMKRRGTYFVADDLGRHGPRRSPAASTTSRAWPSAARRCCRCSGPPCRRRRSSASRSPRAPTPATRRTPSPASPPRCSSSARRACRRWTRCGRRRPPRRGCSALERVAGRISERVRRGRGRGRRQPARGPGDLQTRSSIVHAGAIARNELEG